MSPAPASLPIYLDCDPDPVFATFHAPAGGPARDTAVLLCPPFGWDEVCAYRSLREWAQSLADAGYPALRFSFPSTGDSGGRPRDAGRLTAWLGAVADAASWLHAAEPRRVVAVGIGLGGLIAHLALVNGASIDDLVLWGTPARGHSLVRQLRAFSGLEAQFFEGLAPPPPLPPGELQAGGFLLSAETVRALEDVDLSAMAIPDAPRRRVLLLGREGLAVDKRLHARLESSGADLTVAVGRGYEAMTSHPQQARPPQAVIERVSAWLDEVSAVVPAAGPARLTAGLPSAEIRLDTETSVRETAGLPSAEIKLDTETSVRETPVTIPQPFGMLSGVLVEPAQPGSHGLCALMLNAGAVRRIGPSRLWVEIARHWAALGVPTLRLDIEGTGDSDGDVTPYCDDGSLYVPSLVPQVLATVDFLQARGLGRRFALVGLCAGAYWAFHAALRDSRVQAALMVNPAALVWDADLAPSRDLRALLSQPPSLARIRRAATWARTVALLRWLVRAPRRWLQRRRDPRTLAASAERELDAALEQFRVLGKHALFLFSEHEPLHTELVSTGRMAMLAQWPNVTFEHIDVRDHTMRPLSSQRQMQAALDRALARELELASTVVGSPAGDARPAR